MNLDTPTPPPEPRRTIPFGLQVAFGFFLPAFACGITSLGLVVSGRVASHWSSIGVFFSGILGMLALAGGIWLATKRGWKGVLLGFVLFGAVILLLIGACFAIMAKLGGR